MRKLTRRDVLKTSAFAGLGAAINLAPLSAFAAPSRPIAIFDTRMSAQRGFATWSKYNGFEVIGITHDLDQAWLDLRSRLSTAPVSVIGLTQPSAQVLFAELGASHGLQIEFRGVHDTDASGQVLHRLKGTEAGINLFESEIDSADDWSGAVGPALLHAIERPGSGTSRILNSVASDTAYEAGRLISWTLAPTKIRL